MDSKTSNDSRLERLTRLAKASEVFSPGAPVDRLTLFAGRTDQVRDVLTAVNQRGQHIIIFGERGVGKTSLANVVLELLAAGGQQIISVGAINCDINDNFSSLWHKVFRETTVLLEDRKIGLRTPSAQQKLALDTLLPEVIQPDDVRTTLQPLGSAIVLIDELDRIQDRQTTTLLADTIKTLSDHSIKATLVLVGVADSVDQLIAEHKSVERSLVQVRMPRMSASELFEIINKGLTELDMVIEEQAQQYIARLSQGLPHYTHLLGLHASQEAISADRSKITMSDVEAAIKRAVDKAQQSILSLYHKAISSPRGHLYPNVLLACALSPTDDLGYFAPGDVRRPMSIIMNKSYDIAQFSRHLDDFCTEEHGPILQKTGGPRRYRFRFINPMMQPFVILHGLSKGLLTDEKLRQLT